MVIPITQNGSSDTQSTYWRKKGSEKAELFKKIEPYLTFLNIRQLERQGVDIQSKVQELEDLNSSLREKDKMKDDAIAQLSNQVIALTAKRRLDVMRENHILQFSISTNLYSMQLVGYVEFVVLIHIDMYHHQEILERIYRESNSKM